MVVKFTAELSLAAREALSAKETMKKTMSNSRGGQTTSKGNQLSPNRSRGVCQSKGALEGVVIKIRKVVLRD